MSKTMIFIAGFVAGVITVSSIAYIQVKLRDHVPECVTGEPTPSGARGCVTEIKPVF